MRTSEFVCESSELTVLFQLYDSAGFDRPGEHRALHGIRLKQRTGQRRMAVRLALPV
jgi:hypothetical protein